MSALVISPLPARWWKLNCTGLTTTASVWTFPLWRLVRTVLGWKQRVVVRWYQGFCSVQYAQYSYPIRQESTLVLSIVIVALIRQSCKFKTRLFLPLTSPPATFPFLEWPVGIKITFRRSFSTVTFGWITWNSKFKQNKDYFVSNSF
jgi:hypothetical protein